MKGYIDMEGRNDYLGFVLEKLKDRIRRIDMTIMEGQKEIEGMHEYYWENYTEMDQYGYENYDNQQALLAQVSANQENQKRMYRLKKMQDSPFFGSVEFVYDGEDEPEIVIQ